MNPQTAELIEALKAGAAPDVEGATLNVLDSIRPIDWRELWTETPPAEDWIAWPLVEAGRATALHAPAKLGKSLLVQEMAAAVSLGTEFLGRPVEQRTVCYFDMENLRTDIYERLANMGYHGVEFENLNYYSLPALPPLDTEQGGRILRGVLERDRPAFVVLDSFARVTAGKENDTDTVRAFYQHAGLYMKQNQIAYLRLDNEGYEGGRARGASGKKDDIDYAWGMSGSSTRLLLERRETRTNHGVGRVVVGRTGNPLRHVLESAGDPQPRQAEDRREDRVERAILDVLAEASEPMATNAILTHPMVKEISLHETTKVAVLDRLVDIERKVDRTRRGTHATAPKLHTLAGDRLDLADTEGAA